MKTFQKIGYTNSYYAGSGRPEIGGRCGHQHRSWAAAWTCPAQNSHGGGVGVHVYEQDTWLGYVGREGEFFPATP